MEKEFKLFLGKHMYIILATMFLSFLCFWHMAFTMNIGVDTEWSIAGNYLKELHMDVGRFGLYYSEMLINAWHFSPYINGVMFFALFTAAAVLWLFVMYRINRQIRFLVLFPMLFLTNPLWITQFYFTLQAGSIALAFFLQGLSFLLLFDVLLSDREKPAKIIEMLISVFCAFYAIGTYQSFPGLHIVEGAACLLLLMDTLKGDQDEKHALFWKSAVIVVSHFLLSYLLYIILCKIMHWGSSSYLSISWGKEAASDIIINLLRDFWYVLAGKGDYVGWAMAASLVLIFLLAIYILFGKYSAPLKFDYMLLLGGNVIASVLLNIVIGSVPADRARMPLFFSIAFLGMYSVSRFSQVFKARFKKCIIFPFLFVFFVSAYLQMHRLQVYVYTMDICNAQQYQLGVDIIRHIEAVDGKDDGTVAVIGKWDAPLNPSCIQSGLIGQSSFSWDYNPEKPASATRRSTGYLNAAFGKHYSSKLSKKQKKLAIETAASMPDYPREGYVRNVDGLIVVKLS